MYVRCCYRYGTPLYIACICNGRKFSGCGPLPCCRGAKLCVVKKRRRPELTEEVSLDAPIITRELPLIRHDRYVCFLIEVHGPWLAARLSCNCTVVQKDELSSSLANPCHAPHSFPFIPSSLLLTLLPQPMPFHCFDRISPRA